MPPRGWHILLFDIFTGGPDWAKAGAVKIGCITEMATSKRDSFFIAEAFPLRAYLCLRLNGTNVNGLPVNSFENV